MIEISIEYRGKEVRKIIVFKDRIVVGKVLKELGLEYEEVVAIVNGVPATPDKVLREGSKLKVIVVY